MHTKPTEPAIDFEHEIKELKIKLESRYPLINSDKCFINLLGFVRAKETHFLLRTAGLNGSGGSDSSGGLSLEVK